MYMVCYLVIILIFIFPVITCSSMVLAISTQNDFRLTSPDLKAEVVVDGLHLPTQMAFINDTDLLVLEKNTGQVRLVHEGTLVKQPALDLNVATEGERGLLGIAVSSNKSHGNSIFLYLTQSPNTDNEDVTKGVEPLGNMIYKYDFIGDRLVNPHLLLSLPSKPSAEHNGGVIKIGPDNNLYIVIGDLGIHETRAENENLSEADGTGGILRVTQAGKPVGDGILGNKYPLNLYYGYGIRNSFGIGFDPLNGKLWDTENGPGFGDEINIVMPGFNGGWRQIAGIWQRQPGTTWDLFGNNKSFSVVNDPTFLQLFNGTGKYYKPQFIWNQTVGPTAIMFLDSDKLGEKFQDEMLVGDVHNGRIYHFKLNSTRTGLDLKGALSDGIAGSGKDLEAVIFGEGFGGTNFGSVTEGAGKGAFGITDMDIGPDGFLYVLSIGAGKIFRISPN